MGACLPRLFSQHSGAAALLSAVSVEVNADFARMVGRARETLASERALLAMGAAGEDRSRLRSALSGESSTSPITVAHVDGTRRFLQIDALREDTSVLWLVRDVTPSTVAAFERDRFFSLSLDLLLVATADGTIARASDSFAAILGWNPREIEGSALTALIHEGDVVAAECCLADVFHGSEVCALELRFRCKDGSYRWIAWTCPPASAGRVYAVGRDVTQSRSDAEALRESEQGFRRTFDESPIAAAIVSADRSITNVNDAFCRLTGYAADELVGVSFTDLSRPYAEDFERSSGLFAAAVRGDIERYELEKRFQRKNGEVLRVRVTSGTLRDARGALKSVLIQVEDIERRKSAEDALRASENLFRRLVSVIPDAVVVVLESGQIAEANPAAAALLDARAPSELVGRLFADHFESRESGEFQRHLDEIGRHGCTALGIVEDLVRKGDGARLALEFSAAPFTEHRGATLLLVRDVTARLAADAEIARQREELAAVVALREGDVVLRQIIDLVPHFIFAKDAEGRFLLVNRALADAYGTTARELEGKPDLHFASSAEEAHALRVAEFDVLNGTIPRLVLDESITDASGTQRALTTLKIPFSFAGISAVLGVSTDVTERKQLERQLVQAQKIEGLGRLAGGVAHDFNNILSAILSFAELLAEDLADRPECQRDAESIRDAAMRASELTRQLLAFSRQGEAHPVAVDVPELLAKLERLLHHVLGEDVSLRNVREAGIQIVNVDPGRLEQVIVNLAINARDAMPSGGTLIVGTRNVTPETVTRHTGVPAAGEWVEIFVTDTGTGMTPETQARIFEPFFTTKEVGKGTGLGLATSYGIVKQAGGHLLATSTLGVGTTFHVFLPRSDEQAAAAVAEEVGRPTRPGDETVLVIEDNSFVRKTTTRALERAGYRVLSCASPSEGLEVMTVHHGKVDLLLTDVVMPGMNGFQVADAAARIRPDMKVLFVSGYGADVIDGRGSSLERIRLLAKPFTPAQLAHEVRRVLDGSRERSTVPPSR